MPTHTLLIAPAAKADLQDIYQYGLQQWGQKQSDNYLQNLKEQLWMLARQPFVGAERPELLPGMRSLPVASHILFYSVTPDAVEVIRVLHGRQDPRQHLREI